MFSNYIIPTDIIFYQNRNRHCMHLDLKNDTLTWWNPGRIKITWITSHSSLYISNHHLHYYNTSVTSLLFGQSLMVMMPMAWLRYTRGSFCRSVVEPGMWWDAEQRVCSDSRDAGGERRRGEGEQFSWPRACGAARRRRGARWSWAAPCGHVAAGACLPSCCVCSVRPANQSTDRTTRCSFSQIWKIMNHELWGMRRSAQGMNRKTSLQNYDVCSRIQKTVENYFLFLF